MTPFFREILLILNDSEMSDLEQMLCNKAAPASYQNTCFEYLSGRPEKGPTNSKCSSTSSSASTSGAAPVVSGSSHSSHRRRSKSGSKKKAARATNAMGNGVLGVCPVPHPRSSERRNDDCNDNVDCNTEEVTLQVHEATDPSTKVRSRFSNTADMIHRLFVCIAGVSDQLQSNSAGEMRFILKTVFQMHSDDGSSTPVSIASTLSALSNAVPNPEGTTSSVNLSQMIEPPPSWVPDSEAQACSACGAAFTFLRRRHHCRACGRIFCATCSHRSLALPKHGFQNAVRVCDSCYARNAVPPAAIAAAQHMLPPLGYSAPNQ